MKKIFVILLGLLNFLVGYSQQDFILNGYHNSGGSPDDYLQFISPDKTGSFYVAGVTYSTGDLDPGPSSVTYSDPNDFQYIAKYNKNGQYVWSRYFATNTSTDFAISDSSNLYISGFITSTIDLDPMTTSGTLSPVLGYAGYIAKYDSTGNYKWTISALPLSSPCNIETDDIHVDARGNVYWLGRFRGDFDFDPGIGVVSMNSNSGTGRAYFYAKYSPAGNLIFCKTFGNTGGNIRSYAIATDSSSNIYISAMYISSIDVDPGPGSVILSPISSGSETPFILKVDSLGNYIIAYRMLNSPGNIYELIINDQDEIVISGMHTQLADLDLTANTFNLPTSQYRTFIARYSNNFDLLAGWGFGYYGTSISSRAPLAVDTSGNIYAIIGSTSTIKIFKFNPDGNQVWLGSTGSGGSSAAVGYGNKTLFLGAGFTSTRDINPHPNISTMITAWAPDDDYYWIHVHDCNADSASFTFDICQGDSIYAANNFQFVSGTYYDTLISSFNCDSVIITHLNVHPVYNNLVIDSICYGDSILFSNQYYSNAGIYIDSSLTSYGCDSITTLNLTVLSPPITSNFSLCPGDSIFLQGAFQFSPGLYIDTTGIIQGCESIVYSNVTFGPYSINDSVTICLGDSILLQGNYQFNDSIYIDTLITAAGCDSIIYTHLYLDSCSLVWPGDTDNDSLVSVNDFLPLGVYYGLNGFSRDSISNIWVGHRSKNWLLQQSNGANLKYVDCNGDGIVDLNDTLAFQQNISLTHNLLASSNRSGFDINLVSLNTNVLPGDTILVDIFIGSQADPINSLYGIAFEYGFVGVNPIQTNSLKLIRLNSFLGNINQDLFSINYLNEQGGELASAFTRIDHVSKSGYGSIAQLQFIIDEMVNVPNQFQLIVHSVFANDELGNSLSVNNLDTLTFTLLDPLNVESILAEIKLDVFPNPSSTNVFIRSNTNINHVELYTIEGKLISEKSINSINGNINVSNLSNGSYFMKIHFQNSIITERIIILR